MTRFVSAGAIPISGIPGMGIPAADALAPSIARFRDVAQR
jgi:hypothetical protein